DDLVIGNLGGTAVRAAEVRIFVPRDLSGSATFDDADAALVGDHVGSPIGSRIAGGDFDGDGYDDLVVSQYTPDSAGDCSVIPGGHDLPHGPIHALRTSWITGRPHDASGRGGDRLCNFFEPQ